MTKKRQFDAVGFGIFTLDKKNKKLLPKRARSCAQCQQRKVKCQLKEGAEDVSKSGCVFCATKGDTCSLIELAISSSPTVIATTKSPTIDPVQLAGSEEPQQQHHQQQDKPAQHHHNQRSEFNSIDWLKFMDDEINSNNNNDLPFDFFSINHSPGLAFVSDWDTEVDTTALPLDRRAKDTSYMHYGPSGEYDPWLRYHCYQYDQNNECFFSTKFFRKMGTPQEPVIFAFKERDRLLKESRDVRAVTRSTLDDGIFDRLSKFIPNFIVLYLKFIFPSLPVLDGNFLNEIFSNEAQEYDRNKEHIDLLLLLVLAKSVRRWDTYDTSIDMFTDDDELLLTDRKELFTHAWNLIVDQMHAPNLSTLKSLIIFYHLLGFKKDSQSNGFEKSVLSNMVTLAYSLGLHLDCTSWNIPQHEKNIRARLWWTIYLLEKWGSFVAGSPSMINDLEFSVQMPEDFDFIFEDVADYLNNEKGYIQSFKMALKLTFILNEIWTDLFSARALSQPKSMVFELCDNFESRLKEWRSEFSSIEITGNSSTYSLVLSSYILDITLFRARVRVIDTSQYQELFFDNAKNKLSDIITFLLKLPTAAIHGFWYRWSRSLFMYLKDFVLSLIVMARTKQQSSEVLNLARQFREWLEMNSRGLEILWTTLLRLNIATQSIGTQFKRYIRDKDGDGDDTTNQSKV